MASACFVIDPSHQPFKFYCNCVCMCLMFVRRHMCHGECVCMCMMFVHGHMCHGAYMEDGGQLCAFGFFLLDSG